MPNPLYNLNNLNNNPVPNNPIRNLTDIVYRFNQFKANFNGDPKVAVNELHHTGILGMKWGVRNGPPYPLTSSQMSSSERKANKPSYNVSPKKVKKNMDSMTDAELQRAINRINMQQQVEKMNPDVIERGRRRARRFIADVALAGAVTAATLKLADLLS